MRFVLVHALRLFVRPGYVPAWVEHHTCQVQCLKYNIVSGICPTYLDLFSTSPREFFLVCLGLNTPPNVRRECSAVRAQYRLPQF